MNYATIRNKRDALDALDVTIAAAQSYGWSLSQRDTDALTAQLTRTKQASDVGRWTAVFIFGLIGFIIVKVIDNVGREKDTLRLRAGKGIMRVIHNSDASDVTTLDEVKRLIRGHNDGLALLLVSLLASPVVAAIMIAGLAVVAEAWSF